jgi:carbon-monoxide dehydrogenase medium subunit
VKRHRSSASKAKAKAIEQNCNEVEGRCLYFEKILSTTMYPRPFDYFSPKSLGEALELYGSASEVKILAGGQSLIPSLKFRSRSPKGVVDITGIKELCYIRKDGPLLKIGALTTIAALENDKVIASSAPILSEAAEHIADPLVRNMGTVGGNLCHAHPANDLPAVMLALNASMVATSEQGTRRISADSFFIDLFKTALKPREILTGIEIPLPGGRSRGAYRKVRKGSGGFSIAGVATCLSASGDGIITGCRIAMTAVGAKALRAEKSEQALLGRVPTALVLDNVAGLAVEASQPPTDSNASADYRRTVLNKLVKEAVRAAYNVAARGEDGNYEDKV